MKRNNFKSIYSIANSLYGTTLDASSFEDIALNGWELIGNRETRLYKYTTNTKNKRIEMPCNVEFIEAVFIPSVDFQATHSYSSIPDTTNEWIEQYIESWKTNKNKFYDSGILVKYRQEGPYLVFDKDYSKVTILYHGIIVDEEGLPYLSDKEVQALAAYCAYTDLYKKSLIQKNADLFKLASSIKADWLRLCNSARIPVYINQNEMNDILDVKTRWDRKQYGKSFKPIL